MSDTLPTSIQNNRRLEKWLRFNPDRTVRLAVGKVELGQGNVTALAQIAADELDVSLDRIAVLSGDTQDAPDEGQTTSSQSIEVSGRSVRLVSAELRARVCSALNTKRLMDLLAQKALILQKSEERFRVLASREQIRADVLEMIAEPSVSRPASDSIACGSRRVRTLPGRLVPPPRPARRATSPTARAARILASSPFMPPWLGGLL